MVIFSSQQHQEHLQLRRYGCCQSCKYELLTLSRFRQEKKKNKTKNPKKLKIVLVILYDGGGRYIYYYSTDVCFPIPSRRVHMRGWFSFSFLSFFYLFAVIALAIQCITPVIFPLLFYSQEMSRLCRPSTNVNNVYAVYVRSVYIRAVFTFEEHPWLFIHVQIACMSKYSAHTPAHSQSENWKD